MWKGFTFRILAFTVEGLTERHGDLLLVSHKDIFHTRRMPGGWSRSSHLSSAACAMVSAGCALHKKLRRSNFLQSGAFFL